MTAALYGVLAAVGWGGADFIARFTSRSIGYQQAFVMIDNALLDSFSYLFFILFDSFQ